MKKLFAVIFLMIFAAVAFNSCGNSKVNKAYKAAVEFDKSLDKDSHSDATVELFKNYVATLSELSEDERNALVDKLKNDNLDVCAGIAKVDVQKAKQIVDALGSATADGANRILDAVQKGVEKFDTERLDRILNGFGESMASGLEFLGDDVEDALGQFGDVADSALDSLSSSVGDVLGSVDLGAEGLSGGISNAVNDALDDPDPLADAFIENFGLFGGSQGSDGDTENSDGE